jgi:hypothetical protein
MNLFPQGLASLWQQLVSWPQRSTTPITATEGDERRIWVRKPCNAEVTGRSATVDEGGQFAAKVRNISRGGISLRLGRRYEKGTVLSLELPAAREGSTFTVLACVVHVVASAAGEWTLGCSFSRDLEDEDLLAFGAQSMHARAGDQRRWVRFPGRARASYKRVTGTDESTDSAKVLDLSASGIGLLVNQPIEAGTLLSLELQGEAKESARVILGCVVRVDIPAPGEWVLGCNFIRELSDQEMQGLF